MLLDPIIECLYGWGQVMRLYDDHLDIDGTTYVLVDLMTVHPIYYRVMGVSSARLDLCFKQKKVVLRGIAPTETAQRMASYLNTVCCLQTPVVEVPSVSRVYTDQPHSSEWRMDATKELCQTQVPSFWLARWQLPGHELRQRRIKRLEAERARREHGFDVEQLAVRLQSEALPQVYVPTHLLADECAHYYTNATVCEEPQPNGKQSVYRVKDQGMLILTDRRMIYLGRRRQFVLDYRRLLHVSRLPGALAIMSENWAQREIFEMCFPLECAMYLDAILSRCRKEPLHARTNVRVRQLYPATKTNSYTMHTTTHTTASVTKEQWRSSELFSK